MDAMKTAMLALCCALAHAGPAGAQQEKTMKFTIQNQTGILTPDNSGDAVIEFRDRGLKWNGKTLRVDGRDKVTLPVAFGQNSGITFDMPLERDDTGPSEDKQMGIQSAGPGVMPVVPDEGEDAYFDYIHGISGEGSPLSTDRCGGRTSTPSTHCALYSTMLMTEEGTASTLTRTVFCSGTLLTERHVLTAAHCVCSHVGEEEDRAMLKVVIGHTKTGYAIGVDAIDVYGMSRENADDTCNGGDGGNDHGDLAILTLEAPEPGDSDDPRQKMPAIRTMAMIGEPDWASYVKGELFANFGSGIMLVDTGTGDPQKTTELKLATTTRLTGFRDGETLALDEITVGNDGISTLCSGDSGGGIYKALPVADRRDGFGDWALVGVVVGSGSSNHCLEVDGQVNYEDRNVARLDSVSVREWIDGLTTPETVTYAATVLRDFPVQVAEGRREILR